MSAWTRMQVNCLAVPTIRSVIHSLCFTAGTMTHTSDTSTSKFYLLGAEINFCICVQKKNQLDATEWFIALIICSTCFGHFYAHHQELETISLITAYGVQCLAAGCWGLGAEQQAIRPGRRMLHD